MATKIDEMSARTVEQAYVQKAKAIPKLLVSADSHVDEPVTLWDELPVDDLTIPPEEIRDVVLGVLPNTAMFASRFRECAGRALLLPRRRPDQRTPLWPQRQRAADLLAVARSEEEAATARLSADIDLAVAITEGIPIRDMVRAQRLAVAHLGIERVHAVVGGSMGGLQALEWGILFPELVDRLVSGALALMASAWLPITSYGMMLLRIWIGRLYGP